jgi:hypothetical protein
MAKIFCNYRNRDIIYSSNMSNSCYANSHYINK